MAIGIGASASFSASASLDIGRGGSDGGDAIGSAPLHPFRFLVEFASVTLSDEAVGEAVPSQAARCPAIRGPPPPEAHVHNTGRSPLSSRRTPRPAMSRPLPVDRPAYRYVEHGDARLGADLRQQLPEALRGNWR